MARITIVDESVTFEEPTLVEGFPGVGLVGKITVDHLIDTYGMDLYANIHCEGFPRVTRYHESSSTLTTPVRLYADEDSDLIALQSDVPVNPGAAAEFADCIAGWFAEESVLPIYLSGLPHEKSERLPELSGVAVGSAADRLSAVDINKPPESGIVSGPTGAMLADALERDAPAIGLVVESDPQFPDPEAARTLIVDGIDPIAGTSTDVDGLVEKATEIKEAKQQFAKRMEQATEESSQAEPLKMYQ